jgi:hypothetical protein
MLSLLKRLFGGRAKSQRPRSHGGLRANAVLGHKPAKNDKQSVAERLDNPDLMLDAPPNDGFDPYNTGTFNRSGSWERINKRRNG